MHALVNHVMYLKVGLSWFKLDSFTYIFEPLQVQIPNWIPLVRVVPTQIAPQKTRSATCLFEIFTIKLKKISTAALAGGGGIAISERVWRQINGPCFILPTGIYTVHNYQNWISFYLIFIIILVCDYFLSIKAHSFSFFHLYNTLWSGLLLKHVYFMAIINLQGLVTYQCPIQCK